MAKKITNNYNVNLKGTSADELTNLSATQIKQYDRKNLAKIVTKLASAANKRVKRLGEKGLDTPALRKAYKGKHFGSKDKNLKQLRSEYKRVSGFLKSETSTVKGYKSFLNRLSKNFKEKGVKVGSGTIKETQDFIDKETRIYDWLKERNPFIEESIYKYSVMPKLSEYINQGNLSELAIKKRMQKYIKEEYKKIQESRNIDTSQFFDITEDEE